MNEEIIDELKRKYLEEVVGPSFPFIKYFGRTSWSSSPNSIPSLSLHFPEHLAAFQGSDYYFQNANKFIHYTNLKNAINIINDGFLRLNCLAYMDDPQELVYAGNEFLGNYTTSELKALKEEVFCISFCEYESENKKDNFDSWRLYGDNGLGIGIVFQFSSKIDSWYGNYLGKIQYGKEQTNTNGLEKTTEKFRIFKTNHDKFVTENDGKVDFLSNAFGRKGKIPECIAIFLAFHKSSLYAPENEIRFLRHNNRNDIYSFTLNQNLEKTPFDKLFIKTTDNLKRIKEETKNLVVSVEPNIYDPVWIREATSSNPIIEIEKIIIGYRHSKNFDKIEKAFREGFIDKNRFSIKVELSSLYESFV